MKYSYTQYFIFLFLLHYSHSISAQSNQVTISGFIRDVSSGEMLLGTNVLLYRDTIDLKLPPYRGTSSNNHGFFAIPKLSRGKYFLVISSLGYKTKIEPLNSTIDKGTLRINIDLQPEELELSEVIVKGDVDDKSALSTINIAPDLLEQLPTYSGEIDLFKTLQTISGVKTASELSSGLYIRGGSPDQTLTLIDGVIVYNPTHLGNFASTFNSNAIQKVQLIKGAFPAEYGGRLSSVLDIKLRSGTKEKDKRKIGLGLVNSFFMLEGPLRENTTYMLFGRMMYYDLIQEKFNNNSSVPRYNFKDINTKLTFTLSESNVLSLSGMLTNDFLYNPSVLKDLEYEIGWDNKTINLNWFKIGSNSLFLNSSVNYVNYQFRSLLKDTKGFGHSSDYFASSNLDDFVIKTNAELHWNENNILKIGGELAIHSYNLIYTDIYDPLIENDPKSNTDIFASEATFFIQNDWKIHKNLNANFGGRIYYFYNSNYFDIEPRVSFSYSVNKNFAIKSAYAAANQFLHLVVRNDISLPTDLWYPSTSKIKPSTSSQYVLGVESKIHNEEYLVSIESYYKDMTNLYEFKNGASLGLNNDIDDLLIDGKGEAYGIEFFMNKRAGKINGWIGYTLSWTRRQFPELNTGKIFYPRYDRRHDISLVIGYKILKNLTLGATWLYSSGQGFTMPRGQYSFRQPVIGNNNQIHIDYTARNGYKMPPYHKLDLNLKYRFKYGDLPLQAYITLMNVYNRKNAFAYYLEKDGIDNQNETNTRLKQITLFPFIPNAGITIEF